MAEQDIVSIGYDPAFASQNKEVYDQILQTYTLLKQMDGLKVGVNSGYADLKTQAAALQKQIQELTAANMKLTQSIADGETVKKKTAQTSKQQQAEIAKESRLTQDLANTYKQYSLAARDASIKAKSYSLELGASHPLTIQATKDALEMNTKLKELDATTGVYNRNVGNYSSVLTGYANVLRGVRGPTKLLGEAFGIGAQEADQFRIVLEHAIQGIAAFFRAKEDKAAATAADTAATAANTAAMQAQVTTVAGATGTTNTFTVSTEGAAIAETELAVATTATSTAMRVLKVALLSLGIIAIVAGIGALVYWFYEQSKAAKLAARETKLLDEVNKEANKTAGESIGKLEVLYKVATNAVIPIKERKKAVEELQSQYPEYFKNIKDEIILQGKAAEAYVATKLAILEMAKTQAIAGKLGELATKELDALKEKDKIEKELLKNTQKQADASKSDKRDSEQRGLDQFEAIRQGSVLKKKLEETNKDLSDIAKDREFYLNQITNAGTKNPTTDPKSAKQKKDIANKTAEEILKLNYEYDKLYIQASIDTNQAIFNDETKTYSERLSALETYNDSKNELIERSRKFEIDSENLKYAEIRKNLKSQNPNDVIGGQAAIDAQLQKEKEVHLLRLVNLESKYYDEIRRQGLDYLKEIKKLEQQQLDIKKAFLDQELEYEEWTRKQILKAREAQSKGMAKFDEDDKKRAKEKNNIILNGIGDFVGKAIDLTQALVDRGYTRQQNAIQDLINANNAYGSAEAQRIANSTLNEQEKAAKIIVLNETVAAKNKQLAMEQKQLDIKKAQFDKEVGIAKIILNTAVAATNAMTTGDPYTAGLRAGIVIALGAAELAIAIATPIPTYADGGIHPGGYAIWAEAGVPEQVKEPGKAPYVSYSPTMGILPAGTVLTPLTDSIINGTMQGSAMQSESTRRALSDAIDGRKNQTDWAIARYLAGELKPVNERKQPIKVINKIDMGFASYINKQIFGG